MINPSHASSTRASIANSNQVQSGPVTFDFTNGVVAQQVIGSPGSPVASQQLGDAVLVLTADAGSLVHTAETSFSGYDVVGLDGMTISVDLENPDVRAPAVLKLTVDGGRTFDLTELSVLDLSAYGLTINIRTNKTATPVTFNIPAAQYDGGTQLPSDAVRVMLANEPAMHGIEWAELSNATGDIILLQFDNIVLSNIEPLSTAPVFVEPFAATVNVNQNGSALDLASLLHVNDPDAADTLTWTVVSQVSHGVAQVTGATASGGGADITPGGTLRYTPTGGYAGNDSVTIQVSDGLATATRTINFSVVPQAPGTPDLEAGADTGLLNNDNVTAAASLALSGTSAANDTASTVTVFIDGDADGGYDVGERYATATLANGVWSVSNLSTSGLDGNYTVRAFVTSATGAIASPVGGALAVTIDHTAPTTSFGNIRIANDSGPSSADFNTNVASQTISASLSQALAAGETLRGSVDNGATWVDITDRVSGATLDWTGATLVAGGAIVLRLEDQHGNAGTPATRAYTLDTTAPATGILLAALSVDGNGDFIVASANQTVSGTLDAPLQAGEQVQVSVNGADWADATASTGSTAWSLAGSVLDATGALQVRVLDLAGNAGPVYSRNYIVDGVRPTGQVAADTDLLAPAGASFQVVVTWTDSGGGGLDSASFGTGNISVTTPANALLAVQSYSVNGSVVTYTVAAPDGAWDVQDAGRYAVGLAADSVRDLAGNGVAGVAGAGVIDVAFTNAPSVGSLRLSLDNGVSATDFHTNAALQTIGATLSRALLPGESVHGSLDNGTTWTDISAGVDGASVTWADVVLPASGTLVIRARDADSLAGIEASHAYTIDVAAPTATPTTAALLIDSGTSANDFITNTVAQNLSGVLNTARTGDEFVEVSFDDGDSWFSASGSGSTWALDGVLLPASGTLQVRVADTAGNYGAAWTQAYLVDGAAPIAGTPVRANLVDPAGASFTFSVTYTDSGAGIDTATAGSDNVSVTGPGGILTISSHVVNRNVFTYTVQAPGGDWDVLDVGSYTIGITGTLRDIAGNAVAANGAAHTFTVGVNSAPVLGGAFATPSIDDDKTAAPFAGVTVSDIDGDAVTVTIGYAPANGVLAGAGLGGSAGNYTLRGSAATVQAQLRALVFTPSANQSAGAVIATTFLLAVDDGALSATNSVTVVDVAPVAPTASITLSDSQLAAGETATLTVTFSEAVTGFDVGDLSMPAGTLGALASSDGGRIWRASFTPQVDLASAVHQIVLDLAGVLDAGGLAGSGAFNGPTYTVATARPTAAVAVSDATLTAGETATVTITFSEAVSGFAGDDLVVANGTLSNLMSNDGGVTWSATLTPGADTYVNLNTVTLDLTGVQNAAGNTGLGVATSNVYAVHTGSAPNPTPPPSPAAGTVDGVPVVTTSTTDPVTGLLNHTVTVPFVTGARVDNPATPNADLADIPLSATRGGVTSTLTVGLPVGAGLQASGPARLLTHDQALLDLIHRIEQKTTDGSSARDEMRGEGVAFLEALLQNAALHTATLAPLAVPGGSAPTIAISGGADDGAVIGLVIDATQLPANATLLLDDVDFAAIVGAATLRGGAGNNIVAGDDARQNIFLGVGDDQLFGGGGDDIVGSAGGNDLLDGGSGRDLLVGGSGSDTLRGGSGNDVLQGGGSARGDWQFTLGRDGVLGAVHAGTVFAAAAPLALTLTQLDAGDADLAFLGAARERLVETALLYHAAFERAPDIGGLNYYLAQEMGAAAVARAIVASPEWAGAGMTALSDDAFVRTLYDQVLARTADAEGLAFWSGHLAHSSLTRSDLLLAFALSAEHRALQGPELVIAAASVAGENSWLADSGVDTIAYAGALADLRFMLGNDGAVLVLDGATGDVDTLHGIERGAFSDGVVDLAFTQANAATLETLGLLYQSVLDRSGDIAGFAWWTRAGLDKDALVAGFTETTEFVAHYGALSDADFVAALYANAGLDAGAVGGSAAWVAQLHTATRAELIGSWIGQQAVLDAQFDGTGLWLI
ncbi:hypothetical protein RCH14_000091 [Massilia sp. MP_M2]|uniref:Ig-like domain-containing protein n=1 Tax=Massilia sp. MP_M2 TaxID=3071713 RepID=UPI00319EB997